MKNGIMKNTPAIIVSDSTKSRKGRVVLISPHLEDGEPWTKAHFRNLFRWAAGNDAAETLGKEVQTVRNQQKVRGSWWRTLQRLDPRKYKPLLKDHGVKDSLKILNMEARDSKKKPASIAKYRHVAPCKRPIFKEYGQDSKSKTLSAPFREATITCQIPVSPKRSWL